MGVITDWIGQHDVLLPINQNYDNLRNEQTDIAGKMSNCKHGAYTIQSTL